MKRNPIDVQAFHRKLVDLWSSQYDPKKSVVMYDLEESVIMPKIDCVKKAYGYLYSYNLNKKLLSERIVFDVDVTRHPMYNGKIETVAYTRPIFMGNAVVRATLDFIDYKCDIKHLGEWAWLTPALVTK